MEAEPPDAAPARSRDDGKMLLYQRFDAGTLPILRAAVLEFAAGTGMPPARADDVMIVVHELAANAVRHGAGTGRLRMWTAAQALCCQVDDAGPPGLPDPGRDGEQEIVAASGARASAWPLRPGHGLWLTRELADQMNVTAGPAGHGSPRCSPCTPGSARDTSSGKGPLVRHSQLAGLACVLASPWFVLTLTRRGEKLAAH